MGRIAALLITVYQLVLKPLLSTGLFVAGGCRFVPTCSAYGRESMRQYGLARGFVLLLTRLARCRPGGPVGYDPVAEPRGR